MRATYAKAKRAGKTPGLKKSLEQLRGACDVLREAPTPLIEATYNDCLSTVRFFDEITAFPKKSAACSGPRQEISTASCMSEPIQAIVTKTQTAVENAKAVNRTLDSRKIRGRCYRAIGTSKRDLRNASRIATTADGFDKAIQADDSTRVKRATKEFQGALEEFTSSPSANPIRLLRACRRP